MMTIPSYSMKLIRADEHLQALDSEITSFLEGRPYEVVTEQDGEGVRGILKYRRVPPDLLLMLLGDAIANLRASLDHLAWSLAGSGADRETEFPIFKDRHAFQRSNRRGNPVRGSGLRK